MNPKGGKEERIQEILKESVMEFAQQMQEDFQSLPKYEIILGDSIFTSREEISKPSEYLSAYSKKQDDYFRETAQSILGIKKGEAGEVSKSEEKRLTNKIFNFAGDVLDYSGGYSVSDEAFRVAYRDQFNIIPENKLKEYKIIIPFENLTLSGGHFSLSSEFEIWNDSESHYNVKNIKFSKLTESELSGIKTFEAKNGYPHRSPHRITKFGIRGHIQSSPRPNPNDQPGVEIGRRIATALRLFAPSRGSVGTKTAYLAQPGWLDYRKDIQTICEKQEPSREPPISKNLYELNSDIISEFQAFWSKYSSEIRTDHNYDLATSIRRYNETYVKHYYEDQLIDCAVALESMLLYGASNPGTRSSRMKLRGSILLDAVFNKNRERTRSLIDEVYDFRGDIVHRNKYLADLIEDNSHMDMFDKCKHPKEVINKSRSLLGEVLKAYLRFRSAGYPIANVNRLIDEAIQGASFSVEEI